MSDHDKRGKFAKGNKAGCKSKRTKGVVAYIMEKTDNLKEVLDIAYDMLKDGKTKRGDKIKLIEFFVDRAIGKPTTHAEVEVDTPLPIYFVERKDGEKGNPSN